jgi:hypothetical protein
MNTIRLDGHVDNNHRLSLVVPESVPAGPVSVLILFKSQENDAGAAWMAGIAQEWSEDLNDERQDIYSVSDGDPVHES